MGLFRELRLLLQVSQALIYRQAVTLHIKVGVPDLDWVQKGG